MKRILCITALICVAVLFLSMVEVGPTAAAQTTARLAFLDTVIVAQSGSTFVVTGVAAGSEATSSPCWSNQGFSSTSPAVIGILTYVDSTGRRVTSRQTALTSGLVRGRLSNLVYAGSTCTVVSGGTYDIYEGGG